MLCRTIKRGKVSGWRGPAFAGWGGGEEGVKAVLELEHIHGEQYSHLFHGQLLLEKGGSYFYYVGVHREG